MSPRSTGFRQVSALAAALAILLAACSDGTGSTTPPSSAPSSPPGSAGAACATAPAPPANLPGWDVSSQTPTLFPQIVANPGEITCGPNRLLFSFLDKENQVAAAPDRSASVAFFNLGRDAGTPIASADGTFIWAVEDVKGIYVANVTFAEAGIYGAEFTTAQGSGAAERIRYIFQVQPGSPLVKVGQRAPATDNPTLADTGGDVARISTDTHPEPALYRTSVADALAAHTPFLVAFATPKFCQTAQCGPTLDRLKPFVTRYPGVAFINVEPYKLKFEDGSLKADLDPSTQGLVPVAATDQWGLASEPWVFVVDRDGVVVGSFGLIFSDQELTTALDAVR